MACIPVDDRVPLASFLRVLGTGSSGTVWLVAGAESEGQRAESEWHALKVCPAAETARTEQIVLAKLRQPFIIQFHGATCDPFKSYMLLEACFFGDLASLLRPSEGKRKILSEQRTRDIAARIVSALDYIHGLGIVYRDLKPENIILDDRGLIKLVDFGLAKATTALCYTMCGTPEYLAPEVVQMQGHQRQVDWWALGVCIFEMLHGRTPFSCDGDVGEDCVDARTHVYRRITHPDFKVKYADSISKEVVSCMKRLLRRKPAGRLGSQGGAEVREHSWFASINWSGLPQAGVRASVSGSLPFGAPKLLQLETMDRDALTPTGAPVASWPPGATSATQDQMDHEQFSSLKPALSELCIGGESQSAVLAELNVDLGSPHSRDDIPVSELFCMV